MSSRIQIQETTARRLLQPASGYLAGYDYTLNPYIGCVFACNYCYVRAMPVARFHPGEWGSYLDVKQVDVDAFVRELIRARRRGRVQIFMSSSTDPYQPGEFRAGNTQKLLAAMTRHRDLVDFLLVQTRSPLVLRDVALLQALGQKVLVSMTIETDREDVRRRFTPYAPPLAQRLQALHTLHQAGIPTQVAVSPVLPASDQFANQLVDCVDWIVVDDYFMGALQGGELRPCRSRHATRRKSGTSGITQTLTNAC